MRTFTNKSRVAQKSMPSNSGKLGSSFLSHYRNPHAITRAQHTVYNQVAGCSQLTAIKGVDPDPTSSESIGFDYDFSSIPGNITPGDSIQPKLKNYPPGDQNGQPVDRMTANVLRPIDKKKEKRETEKTLHAESCPNQSAHKSDSLQSRIAALHGSGQPLYPSERTFFEPRFETDFSNVRIHADSSASDTANFINARAFTYGGDIVFGSGQYQPGTADGRHLLAHELAHVVQQREISNSIGNSVKIVQRNDITRMSMTPQHASELGDEDLRAPIRKGE